MNKFTMELVWHNCETNPPEEATNDSLIMTDGSDVFEAFWYRPDGFMIHTKDGWHGVYEDQNKWYWADIRQTVCGDLRFKGLFVDDLVEDFNEYNKGVDTFNELSRLLIRENFDNDACKDCPSNPKNGGTGVCFCTLGQTQITC